MTVSVYNTNAAGVIETVRDEFNAVAFNNNDGTLNWASNWSDNSPDVGSQRVDNGALHIDNQDGDADMQEIIYRSADLSNATTATYTVLTTSATAPAGTTPSPSRSPTTAAAPGSRSRPLTSPAPPTGPPPSVTATPWKSSSP